MTPTATHHPKQDKAGMRLDFGLPTKPPPLLEFLWISIEGMFHDCLLGVAIIIAASTFTAWRGCISLYTLSSSLFSLFIAPISQLRPSSFIFPPSHSRPPSDLPSRQSTRRNRMNQAQLKYSQHVERKQHHPPKPAYEPTGD
jgi:hypothetical protein